MSLRTQLKPADLKEFTERSDLKAAWLIMFNWGLLLGAFAIPILWFHPASILISIILIANRQLGLAILMHECAHYSLFSSKKLNQWVGKLLCGAPVLADLDGYRKYHMRHHAEAGTKTDPDYPNYKPYPVTKQSMWRKVARDLIGLTALKQLYALLLMNAGILSYDMSYQLNSTNESIRLREALINLGKNLFLPILIHAGLFSIFYFTGNAWAYGLWWASYFTVYMLILRIRNAAEHGNVPDLLSTDPQLHARTTYASWWERLTCAPNYVNYHMEHHLRPSVPCYNLKKFHEYLKSKGLLEERSVANGYAEVIRRLTQLEPTST